jgi:ABC-type sugar transport system permease subunit
MIEFVVASAIALVIFLIVVVLIVTGRPQA